MAPYRAPTLAVAMVLVLALTRIPTALAHGDEGGRDHGDQQNGDGQKDESEYPPTYFSHPEHASLMYAHIVFMAIAWVFILPVAVVLSLVTSRYYTYVSQVFFVVLNAIGVIFGSLYNVQTPELYPGNVHHSIGWIATLVAVTQVFIGLVGKMARSFRARRASSEEQHHFIRVPHEMSATYHQLHGHDHRISNDSGQGTEPRTESLRSNSVSTELGEGGPALLSPYNEYDEENPDLKAMPMSFESSRMTSLANNLAMVVDSRLWKYFSVVYKIVDRVILPFGFIALATGIITYGRFFEGRQVFGGLAHWIKGGVFFWLGIFTLGRWSGSFAELGWAWNARPREPTNKWRPSAEFVESALIFFYGSTNIFLEHLGGWGGQWSAQDLEHISITVLFIGGGLCGMLIESTRIRELLNTNIQPKQRYEGDEEEQEQENRFQPPRSYEFSVNPIPALIILLLGIMMSSHQQSTMISSMVHKQWGNLLTGASIARGITYIIVYLRPPTSVFPSRPPTELLASFGLIAGGIIFMASSSDTVDGMIHYDLDAMFIYTVTTGLVGLLMAWVILVLAIKGWALRRERQAAFR